MVGPSVVCYHNAGIGHDGLFCGAVYFVFARAGA